jgi:hypothetical protein
MSTLANKASLISSWARGPFPNARYHWSTHSRFSRSAFGPTGSSGKFQFLRANSRLLFSKKSSRETPVSGSLLSGWPPSSPLTCIGYQIANSSLRKEARCAKASAELRVSQCTMCNPAPFRITYPLGQRVGEGRVPRPRDHASRQLNSHCKSSAVRRLIRLLSAEMIASANFFLSRCSSKIFSSTVLRAINR